MKWFKDILIYIIRNKMCEYKKIEGYDNYSVSNHGNVRNDKTNRILKPGKDKMGYHKVSLCKNKKSKTHIIHRLVAIAYIDNPDNKLCVDHIDEVKTNNHVNNLRFCTHQENLQNVGKQKNNKSGYKGVCYAKQAKQYHAQMMIDGEQKHLGLFETALDASEEYQKAAKKYHGEFFCKN
jgi:hypothetical protein